MAKTSIDKLSKVIAKQLNLYHEAIVDGMKKSAQKNMRVMVKETKAQKYKRDNGDYVKAISSRKLSETLYALEMQWYVKPPHYRLTHLLEYGHATSDGERTIAYGNLGKSSEKAVKQYEDDIMEVIKNGK